jgi:pyruvate/2-oxoglutarate dehydrogenase complex dihydrolipoamide acyltransferase (E2) component
MSGHAIGHPCRRHLAAALQFVVGMAERIDIRIEDPGDSAQIEVLVLRVAAGDQVKKGSVLLEVATDKANVEIEAPADGVVEKLLVAKGDVVKVDRLLAVLLA